MSYQPETGFSITEDSRLVYNLRQDGWRKGQPVMVNDIAVGIEARHLPAETQAAVARLIHAALNSGFGPDGKQGLTHFRLRWWSSVDWEWSEAEIVAVGATPRPAT